VTSEQQKVLQIQDQKAAIERDLARIQAQLDAEIAAQKEREEKKKRLLAAFDSDSDDDKKKKKKSSKKKIDSDSD